MNHSIVFLFALLLTASLMWPSEGAIHGDGLHLACGWLLAAAVATIASATGFQQTDRMPRSKRICGIVVAALIGGVWLSTWHVFRIHGDRRSALNLAMEWSAIAAGWWLCREFARNVEGRQWIVSLLISLSVGAAFVGICQHHVTYERQGEWYRQQRARMDEATGDVGAGAAVAGMSAAREFRRLDIPTTGPARELFERRLLDSSEPSGPFALANTLGGVLAVALVLLIGGVLENLRNQVRMSLLTWTVIAVVFFVVGYSLLLTKSRTAWVGLAVGTASLLVQSRSTVSASRLKRLIAGGLLLLTAGTAIGIGTGAIDREVVLESPRSLQFRLFYWMGAASVIAENPIFGSGPGNFRQCYLRHKAVESSEEILDPHNILLDSWCSAGIVGFAAMCVMAVTMLASRTEPISAEIFSSQPSRHTTVRAVRCGRSMVLAGTVGGLVVHVLWRWFHGDDLFDMESQDLWDSVNLVLLVPLAGLVCFPVLCGRLRFSRTAVRAAFGCLLVHLLGAGGLQIVGLGLLLLLLFGLSSSDPDVQSGESGAAPSMPLFAWIPAVVFAIAAAATLWLGLIPVFSAARQTSLADILRFQGRVDSAVDACDAGIAADSLGTDSRQRKMDILAYQFVAAVSRCADSESQSPELLEDVRQRYDQALAACNDLISADERSLTGYYFRSRLAVQFHELQPAEGLRTAALKDMQRVIEFYPANSTFWCEYADLQFRLGFKEDSRASAAKAFEIDKISHDWGHIDRYLDSDRLARLREIADST